MKLARGLADTLVSHLRNNLIGEALHIGGMSMTGNVERPWQSYRRRRRSGLVPLTVEVPLSVVDVLVDAGLVHPFYRSNKTAVAIGLEALLPGAAELALSASRVLERYRK